MQIFMRLLSTSALHLALVAAGIVGATVTPGPVSPDGHEVQNDLPKDLHRRNISNRGQGSCVFTSIHHAAIWQGVAALADFPKWLQEKGLTGGGYPGNVEQRINVICKERGVPVPPYLQIQGKDIEILKLACKTGRIPGVTYGFSPSGRYGGARIAHMVTLLHADDVRFCVLDSNYVGSWEWMTPAEFQRTYTSGGGGWCVILLDSGPPPMPEN